MELYLSDFTLSHYEHLLALAKKNYKFVTYDDINFNERFILWRHDCDFSLNRALKLAELEHQSSVVSTFFINFHSEFYNVLERGQAKIIERILNLGHRIGLHFDADFYEIESEDVLDELVCREASQIEIFFGVMPTVFSFHNPTAFLLSCEKEKYGGLLNCYSSNFKANIAYCSDSNGYWRFKRLYDVLSLAEEKHLQVLTHPGWWQEQALYPQQRVERCVMGRANTTLSQYIQNLELYGRKNIAGDEQG